MDSRPASDSEFREVIASIGGEGIFGKLKFEPGLHRIQRMIQQEGRDRVRTLLVHLDVLPLPPAKELEIADTDLSVTRFRLARPGSDNMDGADSITHVTHLPTGLEAEQRNDTTLYGASDRAMKILRARVFQRRRDGQALIEDSYSSRPVRTYNIPQDRIRDRRAGLDLKSIDDVLSSEALARIIKSLIATMPEKDGEGTI